jgi:hypothetical protein
MLKEKKNSLVSSFMAIAMLGILFVACSNNPLANTTWQDTGNGRTITFGENTCRWVRDDTGKDMMGIYTISKDAVILSFDDGVRYTGSLSGENLSFTVNVGYVDESHVEFHRVR